MKLLKNPWVGTIVGAVLYSASLGVSWQRHIANHPATEAAGDSVAPIGASWDFQNPEIEQLVAELKKEKEALTSRRTELEEWSARLQAERLELNQATQQVHQLQTQFDRMVVRVQDEEAVNLKKMAKTYAAMAPATAARIFKELDDLAVVKVFRYMKETETAPILEVIAQQGDDEAKRAAAIAEKLRLSINDSPTKPKS